jgi:glycosyltransferase involved in cell wall biosynthesis
MIPAATVLRANDHDSVTEVVDVSVIVCTYNRADMLPDAIRSLTRQSAAAISFEIIIVDNASSDDTRAVAEALIETAAVPVRYVYAATPGVSAARNRGVAEARGEWIAFMDDDQVADAKWLAGLWETAQRRKVRCVGGVNRLKLPAGQERRTLSKPLQSLLGCTLGIDAEGQYPPKHAPGAGNLLVHRGVFDEVGTFDESLSAGGEDVDLYRRIFARGERAWCTPLAITFHVVPAYRLDPAYLRWKCQRNGSHLARRDFCEKGRLRMVVLALLRMAASVGVYLPRLLAARLARRPEEVLGKQCLLWKATGYVRIALHLAAHQMFPQQRFVEWLDLRSEQTSFAQRPQH